MADVEMRDLEDDEEALPPIALEVLQYVRTAQAQHGMRHNDNARYRQYCTKKMQRLRKNLKLQQGRGKFVRKKLDLSAVTAVGHLQLPLASAERSWAWAQESKAQMDEAHAAKMRQHTLRRLAKAALYANQLALFASKRGTARTAIEAEAYAAHMSGLHLMEYSDRHQAALGKLHRALKLCQILARVGSFEQQAVAQQRLDEIEPVFRFAKYQLSQSGAAEAGSGDDSSVIADLKDKLATLDTESRDAVGLTAKKAPGGPAYLQWRGTTHTVFGERLKGNILQAAELAPELEKAQRGGSRDEQQAILEKLVAAFSEAKGIVRHSLATAGGSGAEAADAAADLKALDVVVSGKQLEFTIQKNLLLVAEAEGRLESNTLPNPTTDQAAKKSGKGKKARGQGPMAVVRIYDSLLSNLKDLTETAGQLGGAAGEYLLDDCNAQAAEMRARRCFFVARSYFSDGKPKEAEALFRKAQERVKEAVSQHEECAKPDAAAIEALEALSVKAGAWRVIAQAKALAAAEEVAEEVKNLEIEDGVREIPVKYLTDDLDSWKSYAGGEAEPPRLAPIPPRLQPVALRPIMLDCALSHIRPPDFSHRLPKEERKSTIGRLFGWGGSK